MIKIKNTKKNVFYNIVGRITVLVIGYAGIEFVGYRIIEYIINNCITTL